MQRAVSFRFPVSTTTSAPLRVHSSEVVPRIGNVAQQQKKDLAPFVEKKLTQLPVAKMTSRNVSASSKVGLSARKTSSPFSMVHSSNVTQGFQMMKPLSFRFFSTDAQPDFTPPPTEPVQEAQIAEPEVEIKEKPIGPEEKHTFQAETTKLLDIVARSLYTDKEVFIRELISNASDALEKLRYRVVVDKDLQSDLYEINIYNDEKNKRLIIQDSGIGMTNKELAENLGSIGHSGSLDYIKNMKEKNMQASDIIGQFGVGFYSVFMVAKEVNVYSRSAVPGSKGYVWKSKGAGEYTIAEAENVEVGTKIVLDLDDANSQFASKEVIERIIKNHSNFVGFPIKLNGNQFNTVKPLWTWNKKDITEQDHKDFYQFVTNSFDDPAYHLHFATDSPLSIKALFYVGNSHNEKYGMGRMEPGVNLYSRKVLIQQRAKDLLPDYLRFVKGVVDSEDIPLNLSREHLQDSSLIRRISNVLTKRILKWLDDEAKKDPAKYAIFWEDFGSFIREGVCTNFAFKEDAAKLLRAESSAKNPGELVSLDEYIGRISEDQKQIFYLAAPTRDLALKSPYYEGFKAQDKEVLFFYGNLDDFVMANLQEYNGRKLISIESQAAKDALSTGKTEEPKEKLEPEQVQSFSRWMKDVLAMRVSSVQESTRLVDTPAIIIDDSLAMRRMMLRADPTRVPELPKQQVEINPGHPVIVGLNAMRDTNPNLAKLIAEQVFDNALIAAGLTEDTKNMVPRLTQILASAVGK